MNKQQLANKIWASANKMRSKIEANEYKDYILGFIFYKFLSDKVEELLLSDGWSKEDLKNELTETCEEADKSYIKSKLGYFICYRNLFSTWVSPDFQFDASYVTDALYAFGRNISSTHKKVFNKIFDTLQTGLSKLGETNGARTKAIYELLKLIKDIPTDDSQDYDVLGFIYEYLISNFAANAGKKAGEFYTPHEVALLMAEIVSWHLRDRGNIEIYDPTSGSGSLLINIGQAASKHLRDRDSIKYYAQELKENTYNLTRMNLVMRGIKPGNIEVRCGDTLDKDWPIFDDNDPLRTYRTLYVDAVVSNPPYSQGWDNTNKDADPRYKNYGVAPKGKADYAFLLHDLYHVKPDGIMTIVLPHGVLFRGKEEENIRRSLVEKNNIDAIIGLPANIFFGTGIPTIIMVLRQKRERDDVLIVDASRLSEKVGKQNKLTASDIKRIADTYIERNPQDSTFARLVNRQEIRDNGYNLNIPRYIDSADKPEPWDAHSIIFGGIPIAEIEELGTFWSAFPTLTRELFTETETPYTEVLCEDTTSCIKANTDVNEWQTKFKDSIKSLPETLHTELIDNVMSINKDQEKHNIADRLFEMIQPLALVDKYKAYQILDNNWRTIATDIEIIQTEGFEATKVVEPHYVIKKKDDKEVEVQDGWQGRILPFELVQKEILTNDYNALQDILSTLSSKETELEDIKQRFNEEDLQDDFYDSEKQSFIAKGVNARVKALRKELKGKAPEAESFEETLLAYDKVANEIKTVKKTSRDLKVSLTDKTRELIPSLSEGVIKNLLHKKWIEPLDIDLQKIPDSIINEFTISVSKLIKKYARPLQSIEKEKKEVESKLSTLLSQLTGNEYDMAALYEFKTMIGGKENE